MAEKNKVEYHLKSAKLRKVKDNHVLDVEFDEVTTTPQGEVITCNVVKSGGKAVHQDLLDSLKMILPHYLILSENKSIKDFKKVYLQGKDAVTDTSLDNFAVTGVHMKEKSEVRQVVILGRRILASKRVISGVLPMQSLSDSEENYEHTELLTKAVDGFLDEAEKYLAGKYAPTPQLSLEKDLDASMKKAS